jgi:DnaK suppressor protein
MNMLNSAPKAPLAEDDDYMNAAQLGHFRSRLTTLRSALEESLQPGEEIQMESTADPADRATLEEERNAFLKLKERAANRLREVNDALKRIDEGEYGYCVATGEPIGVDRLEANPTATMCIAAQTQREHTQRMFATA